MAIKAEHAFDTDALTAVIERYSNKLRFIKTAYTLIAVNAQYDNMPYITTDKLTTFDAGGYDMLELKSFDSTTRCTYTSVIRVEDIIDFVIVENETDRINPFQL